jgi:hypothetical protein
VGPSHAGHHLQPHVRLSHVHDPGPGGRRRSPPAGVPGEIRRPGGGGVLVDRFFRKYAGQPPDSILPVLFRERRLSPLRMAWAFRSVAPEAPPEDLGSFIEEHAHDATLTEAALRDICRRTDPEGQSLADLGYLASVHPLELWLARFLRENPESTRAQVMEAFNEVLRMWNRVGYPFDNIVPSLGSSIGNSGDRPAALAELVGILLNDGVLLPSVRVEELQFAVGTPYEVILRRRPVEGTRILSSDVSAVAPCRGLRFHGIPARRASPQASGGTGPLPGGVGALRPPAGTPGSRSGCPPTP